MPPFQGKLGRPKPDQCRSGVRGVFFDKQAPHSDAPWERDVNGPSLEEKAWVARFSNCGMKTYAMFSTEVGQETGGGKW